MRCMACGAEMHLVQVEPDATMAVPGYAHHTFECPACKETERRLTFNAHAPSQSADPLQASDASSASSAAAPVPGSGVQSVSPGPAPPSERIAASSGWARAVEKVRSKRSEMGERAPDVAEPVRAPKAASAAPGSQGHDESNAPRSAWARAVAKLRGRFDKSSR
jgi:hypothetical protein